MIPRVVPPLTGLTILVTRPQPQASMLAQAITALGGDAVVFPSIAIEPCSVATPAPCDWLIFASVHAVEFGVRVIARNDLTKVAAIGKATAAALTSAGWPVNVVPDAPYTSEALLSHANFSPVAGQSALIVRGVGGREMLRESLAARGIRVDALEVYRRCRPEVARSEIEALVRRWREDGFDAVTATSAETYSNLHELLTEEGRQQLQRTPLLAPTRRVLDAARALGWDADELLTIGADDTAIIGTLARWSARNRDR